MPRQNQAGVTLIELMVVVAVVGILASVAFPSYRRYVLRANRTDAVRSLTLNAQILQRCYSQNFTFNLGACTGPLAVVSANNNYNLTFANLTNNTYTLTATPRGTQVADTTCASFTVDQAGRQTAVDNLNANQSAVCWGAN